MIFEWQLYAGKYHEQTLSAHLSAIRAFEVFCELKSFEDMTAVDADRYRKKLIESCETEGSASRSTVRHQASYLSAFFRWMISRGETKSMPDLSGYFALPKGLCGQGETERTRDYIDLDLARRILEAMPSGSLLERRDRAIFAFAYLSGLRENALITVQLKHIDVPARLVFHDGKALRAKNGKSFTVTWFPATEAFAEVFESWFGEVRRLGLGDNDSVFPSNNDLERAHRWRFKAAIIRPMRTAHAVDAVFKLASQLGDRRITPHPVRDTLAKLGDERCRTTAER